MINLLYKINNKFNEEISTYLNETVSSRESHHTNIKKALKVLKDETNGYVNYYIILDIKK